MAGQFQWASPPWGGVVACVVGDSPFASLATLVDRLARNAASGALAAPLPADLEEGSRPIDDEFIQNVRDGASPPSKAAAPKASYFSVPSARGALADAAARTAIDAVRAEVAKRAAIDFDVVDASKAVVALDAPLLLVAATGDTLIPPRPNAGRLLKLYANAKEGDAKARRQRDAELLLVKGGHNSKRPYACQKKTYEFLAKHLQGARGGVLAAKIDALDDYKAPIRESRPPWAWCAQTAAPPPAAKNLGDAFRSGMTADREKQMGKDISNIFGGGK